MPLNEHPELKVYINPQFAAGTAADLQRSAEILGQQFAARFKNAADLNVTVPSTATIGAAGANAGAAYAAAFSAAAHVNVPTPTAPNTSAAGQQAARQYADAFDRTLNENIKRALASMPDANVHINDAAAQATITDLKARMERLTDKDIRLTMDAGQITAEIAAIDAQLTALHHQGHLDIDVQMDINAALGHLAVLQAAIHSVGQHGGQQGGNAAGISFTQAFMQHITILSQNAQQGLGNMMSNLIQPISPATIASFAGLAGVIALVGAAALALIPVLAVLVSGLGGLLAIGVALGAGFAVLALALAPLIKKYTELEQKKQAAAQAAEQLKAAHERERQATQNLASAQENLEKARASAQEQNASAVRALADARANAHEAEMQAIAAQQDAEDRLTQARRDAAQAEIQAQRGITEAREQASRAVAAATETLARAQENLARVKQEGVRAIQEADERIKAAEEDAAQAVAAAHKRVIDAQAALDAAQAKSLEIGKQIAAQRQQDKKDLEDLNRQIKQNALDQMDAATQLQNAQAELSRAMGTGDGAAIGAAQSKVARAQLALDGAKDQGKDLKDQATELRINGSKQLQALEAQRLQQIKAIQDAEASVAAAKAAQTQAQIDGEKRVRDAEEARARALETNSRNETEARRQIAAAREAANRAAEDGARRVQEAEEAAARQRIQNQRAVTDAERAVAAAVEARTKASTSGARQVADAEAAVAKTQQNGAEQVKSAQAQVEKATSELAEAHHLVGAAAAAAKQKQTEATKGMTPAVTGFFATLKQFAARWSAVGEAAQNQMLPRIATAMQKLDPLLRPLSGFAGQVGRLFGDFAIKAANALTGPWWRQWGSDMGPRIVDVLQKMGNFTGNVITGIAGIAQAFMPLGQNMAGGLQDASKRFSDWAKNLKDNPSFKGFIAYVKENAPKVGQLLSGAFNFMKKFFQAGSKPGGDMLTMIKNGFVALGKIDYNKLKRSLQEFADKVRAVANFLKDWGPTIAKVGGAILSLVVTVKLITTTITALSGALRVIRGVIAAVRLVWTLLSLAFSASPIGVVVVAIAALSAALIWFFTKTETGKKVWNALVNAFKTGVEWIKNNWKKPFDAIGHFFTKTLPDLKDKAVKTIGDLLGAAGRKIGDVGAWAKKTFVDPFGKAWESIKGIFDWKKIFKDFDIEKILKGIPGGGTTIKVLKGLHLMNQGGLVPSVQMLPRYSNGGLITGPYLGPRADNVLALNNRGEPTAFVNPGEFILPVFATMALAKAFGPGILEWLRTFDVHGGAGGPFTRPGLAEGGYVPSTSSNALSGPYVRSSVIFGGGDLPRYASGGRVTSLPSVTPVNGSGSSVDLAGLTQEVRALRGDMQAVAQREIALYIDRKQFAVATADGINNYNRGR